MDERVQSADIPRDVTDMMIAEKNIRENVTAYMVMSLLNKHGAQDTRAHEDNLMLDSGANIHCSMTTDGMRNVKQSCSKVLVANKSKVMAQYRGDLSIIAEKVTR